MKSDRQKKINEIISEFEVETQEDLQIRLQNAGFDVTQATVSRDIREMGLTKVSSGHGSYRYAAPNAGGVTGDKYRKILSEATISADHAGNLVVVKTYPGMAQAAASALDNIGLAGILGSIAGDDTILVVSRTETSAAETVAAIVSVSEG